MFDLWYYAEAARAETLMRAITAFTRTQPRHCIHEEMRLEPHDVEEDTPKTPDAQEASSTRTALEGLPIPRMAHSLRPSSKPQGSLVCTDISNVTFATLTLKHLRCAARSLVSKVVRSLCRQPYPPMKRPYALSGSLIQGWLARSVAQLYPPMKSCLHGVSLLLPTLAHLQVVPVQVPTARGTPVAQVPLPFADAKALTAVEALMSATAIPGQQLSEARQQKAPMAAKLLKVSKIFLKKLCQECAEPVSQRKILLESHTASGMRCAACPHKTLRENYLVFDPRNKNAINLLTASKRNG